ncbi:MAG: glycerol-3-phosphate 1-O-acyltransferase PlsY [Acidobacteria bacterium]|nr:glycerol-3-phosphate 1-O-acyltransferase PlsY [Acidobacteriota bacterium]
MMLNYLFLPVLLPYLIGSIPFAVWTGQVFYGKDVRDEGSGNAGATNMYRVFGIVPAIAVFLLDAGKGTAVILICRSFQLGFPWVVFAAFFVVLGHIYPLYAGFSGGKGVSTAAGVVAALSLLSFFAGLCAFVFIVWRFRLVSAASITGAIAAFMIAFADFLFFGGLVSTVAITGLYLILIIFSHRSNIRRLINGTELRAG